MSCRGQGKDYIENYQYLVKICQRTYGYLSWLFMKKNAKSVLIVDCLSFVDEVLVPCFIKFYEKKN